MLNNNSQERNSFWANRSLLKVRLKTGCGSLSINPLSAPACHPKAFFCQWRQVWMTAYLGLWRPRGPKSPTAMSDCLHLEGLLDLKPQK